ncbi:MAG: hypothetical protein ACM3MD_07520 [Betaproteobacteria bacterium]
MKITISLLTVLALVLTFGLAYAYESVPMTRDMGGKMEAGVYNGITVFETGPAPDCSSISGVGAGGLSAEARPVLENGITSFDLGLAGSGAKGSCAGAIGEPSAWLHNGITVFDEGKY